MTFTKQDFKLLRWPLLGAVVLVAAGAAAMLVSEQYVDSARERRKATQSQRTAAQDRVARAAEEEREIRANLVHYRKMMDAGIVGPKDRLDLIERIAAIKTQRKLFEIRYNISPQRALDYPGMQQTGAMDFVNSQMRLDMMLLHEEDLLNFLADLQGSKQTYVVVRHCTLQRVAGAPTAATAAVPTLKSECTVDLVNLVEGKPS